jgi:GNAT superfamily N-acetyltransferase
MPDLLVKLFALPDATALLQGLQDAGVEVRRAAPSEKADVAAWVRRHFQESWARACEVALARLPGTCYVAVEEDRAHVPSGPYDLPGEALLGFVCYDVDIRGMLGPMGVREASRGRGIGRALLLTCLRAMAADGYAYAVVGWAGPVEFYARCANATVIEGSEPGPNRGRIVG